jgi:transcriptional regulator with XRE-family HTH domain
VKNERLRLSRERKGLSQGEAAKKMGIVRTTYSNYEAGNREPDNETLKKISEFFEVSIDYLLGNDGVKTDKEKAQNDVMESYYRLSHENQKLIDNMIKALEKE